VTGVPDRAIRKGDGDDVLAFIEAYGRITKDSIAGPAGEPLGLRPWQERLVRATFARDPVTGRRLHRTAIWGMARKNGKTGLVAPIALYGLLLDGAGAEVYSCAADRDQAKLVFGAAKRTVELVPELAERLRTYRDAIEDPQSGSVYRALSSEAYTKEGLSPTLVLADELHAWPNRELYDVMALAMGARRDPLMLIVTTAGVRTDTTGQESIAYRLWQYGSRVASGEIADPTFFMAWWAADDDAPVLDPVAHKAANPGLGDILDATELVASARKATTGGFSESEFRIKRLNCWVASAVAALPSGRFEALAEPRHIAADEPVVLFFDGSFNHDCTALLACTPDGYMETVACWERPIDDPGWRVPISEVDAVVRAVCRDRKVIELACDPFRWAKEMEEWEAAGLPVVKYTTSSPSVMVPAWAKFYDAVIGGTLHHDGDPRLVRHVQNMVLKVDRLGPRPVKEHRGSPRSIDLGICAVGAYDRATWHASQPVTTSVYLERGAVIV
jgi:phage terminase large subunit-like protein